MKRFVGVLCDVWSCVVRVVDYVINVPLQSLGCMRNAFTSPVSIWHLEYQWCVACSMYMSNFAHSSDIASRGGMYKWVTVSAFVGV